MKKYILKFGSILLSLGMIVLPLQANAIDRIAATFTNGDAHLKEGALNSGWRPITGGVSIGNLSLAGDRIALFNTGSVNKEVAIKEPAWNSPWEWATWGSPNSTKTLVSQLSNGQQRLLVLRADGSVIMKDGPWNTGWWSGAIADSDVSDIVIGNDRIGVIMSNGDFKVKQLTPGQFSHPNNTSWDLEATGVTSAAMTNNWIAYLNTSNNVYAKEGGTTTPWFGNHTVIYDNTAKLRVGGNRLCVLKATDIIECKEGGLGASSKLTFSPASDFKVSASRVAVNTSDNKAYVLEGSLLGPNSGWQLISNTVSNLEIN